MHLYVFIYIYVYRYIYEYMCIVPELGSKVFK